MSKGNKKGISQSKVGIVTGAASGVGLALREELYLRGAGVIMVDKDQSLLNEAVEKFKKSGGTARAVALIISDFPVIKMVGRTGLEPVANGLKIRCSSGLSYRPA